MSTYRFRPSGRHWMLLGLGLLAASPLVLATEAAVDPQALGIADSILTYCGRFDPATADKLRERIKQLEDGASEQQLAQIRSSEEYRKAHDSMDEFVGKVDERNAKRVCSAPPAQKH